MVRSIIGDWKYVINYVVINKSFSALKLSELIKKNLKLCEEKLGLRVVMLTCDQGAINMLAYKHLGITLDMPYFILDAKKIYSQYDPPHLIKSTRNAFINNKISHNQNGIADIDVIRKIVDRDGNNKCKILPKIGRKHLYPNCFEKMNVSLAAQLLSDTVSCAIRTVEQTCPEILSATIENVTPTW